MTNDRGNNTMTDDWPPAPSNWDEIRNNYLWKTKHRCLVPCTRCGVRPLASEVFALDSGELVCLDCACEQVV